MVVINICKKKRMFYEILLYLYTIIMNIFITKKLNGYIEKYYMYTKRKSTNRIGV